MEKVPLKTVLRNFLDHYQKLEKSFSDKKIAIAEIKKNGRETPPPLSLYDQEYIKLKELTEFLKNDPNYPMHEGQSDVNRKKNRYKDILPYDQSRVILSEYPGVPGSDYINANYVRGSSGNQRAYIASQGPLPNTLVDFWRMIWETDILVIVMACNEREAGKYKCEPYWPIHSEEKQQYGNITVEHVKWRQVCPDFLVRTFRVIADNEERTICQFHYTTWPDHGVPISVHPILELVRLMRDVQSSESRPILVHCSAGCGRTGTICSIDYVWALLRTGKLREDFSLYDIIRDMRRQRTSMVQTVEQYILCYKAVATLFEQHLKLIDTHTYQNIDVDGIPIGYRQEEEGGRSSSLIVASSSSPTSLSTSSSSQEGIQSSSLEIMNQSNEDVNNITTEETSPKIMFDRIQFDSKPKIQRSQSFLENATTSSTIKDSDEVRHEKVIGRATVIRRPSIAQLRAIFDNPSNEENVQQSATSNQQSRLQRSQSIKEDIRNLNFNIQLEINQSKAQNRKSKSYTLSAAKLSVYKKHYSIGNLAFDGHQTDYNEGGSEQKSSPTMIVDDCAIAAQRITNIKNAYLECANNRIKSASNRRTISSMDHIRPSAMINQQSSNEDDSRATSTYGQRLMDESGIPNAPPKPPRTYQHIMDDSCIVRTTEGRLIVTVAQPRQSNSSDSGGFIPIGLNSQTPQYGYSNSNANNSIYEPLSNRKFHLSSPNLMATEQQMAANRHHFVEQSKNAKINVQSQGSYRDSDISTNTIYSNAISSKSFSSRPTPMAEQYSPFVNHNGQYPIDVFGNQHFQYHQAKPFILQQNFFEPIYGSTRPPYLPPRPSNLIASQTTVNCQGLIQQQPPPPRPRSISHGNFKQPNSNANYDNIYSNREICFKLPPSSTSSLVQNTNANQFAPIRIQPKENVYAEIGTLSALNLNHQSRQPPKKEGDAQTQNKVQPEANSSAKNSIPFSSKIRSVFNLFRLRSSSKQSSENSNSMITSTVTNTTNVTDLKQCNLIGSIPSSTSQNLNGSKLSSINAGEGQAINPGNGQPMSRPPHSHRFQVPTQWTQV
ncbi:hypothetical protein RDWZM_006881 [Blomia tropicalis]|uniref:protein-tyrosine-phosphatase n=1 Tax=Blomia tropicalis TaxID=40697 RepID=A0A9Q0M8X5_BLOTA|nr:hypothetical protein RDWZM_006881 [Blomia tropicalis]